jgi:hypothetical protein
MLLMYLHSSLQINETIDVAKQQQQTQWDIPGLCCMPAAS